MSAPALETTRPPQPGARPSGTRTLVRILGATFSLLLVLWGALTLVALLAEAHESRSGTYDGVAVIEFDLGFESVEVVGSPTATEVSMERTYRWSLSRPDIETRQDGDRLLIGSDCNFNPGRWCSGQVRLVVPADVRLEGRGEDGSVTLEGLTNDVRLEVADGSVSATDLTGRLRLETADGSVWLRDVTGEVEATTSDGSIDIVGGSDQPMNLSTSDGSVDGRDLHSSDVRVATSDGGVRLSFVATPDRVGVTATDGSVDIAVPDDVAYDVAVDTADGSRDVSVPTDPASSRRIEVRTSDGSVRISAP